MDKILVIGAGIGGIHAALELAEAGYYVHLVEKSPFLGGLMAQIFKTYPTCFYCHIYPKLSACINHFNIEVLTQTQVEKVEGEAGDFQVTLIQGPQYVNNKCNACGICASKCPVKVNDPFLRKLQSRKAIYLPYASVFPNRYVIDTKNCLFFTKGECKECERVCPVQAIDFNAPQEVRHLNVGAIILASGARLSDASIYDAYNYLKLPSVITSMEFERLIKNSIATLGDLVRPWDRKKIQRVAWLQCVGSRDVTNNHGYCSSVCCMYALKEAIVTQKRNIQGSIFFMDLRAYGKKGEQYLTKAKEAGVRFIRSRVHAILESPENGNVIVRYASPEGGLKEEEFDLAVLSVGFSPSPKMVALAQKTGIALNHYDFVSVDMLRPVQTSRAGIYTCGVFQEPKDILDTTIQASAAAAEASLVLKTPEKVIEPYPPVFSQEPRLGVFICQCQGSISDIIKIDKILEDLKQLPQVVCAKAHFNLCSLEGRQFIKEKIKEFKLDRMVIAACSPRLYETHFKKIGEEVGLNPYLIEIANIREQCAWVHADWQEAATEKATEIIKMAVAKIALEKPLLRKRPSVFKKGLVIGGGIAGLSAALHLAKRGIEVYLVERTEQLGGIAKKLYFSWQGRNIQSFLKELIEQVEKHPLIKVFKKTEIVETKGKVGAFTTTLNTPSGNQEVHHGIIIIATGGKEDRPADYLYGKHSRVLSLLEIEEKIAKGDKLLQNSKNVVFIQCVGSRDDNRPYCSRVCCTHSLKNAIQLKEKNPEINIYILYRDIRTFGFREDVYRKARNKGIVFIRYDLDKKPQVEMEEGGSQLKVKVYDPILREELVINADILALALPIIPSSENKKLAQILNIPLDEFGFFQETLKDLSVVDTPVAGIFICGLSQGPKFMEESIAQAMAAANRGVLILSKDEIFLSPIVSQVVDENCDGCGYCIDPCPYNALSLIEYIKNGEIKKTVESNPFLCQGCGICQATCPKKGIYIPNHSLEQFSAMIDMALKLS